MALDTFANLKTSIANYLNRDDLTSYIPDFIALAEARHGRDLRLRITLIGERLYFGPTPDSNYSIEWAYYAKPTALSDDNTSNAILINHPDLYLYASLLESSPFLMQDERLGVWAELYREAVRVANSSDESGRHSSGPLQMTAKSVA